MALADEGVKSHQPAVALVVAEGSFDVIVNCVCFLKRTTDSQIAELDHKFDLGHCECDWQFVSIASPVIDSKAPWFWMMR